MSSSISEIQGMHNSDNNWPYWDFILLTAKLSVEQRKPENEKQNQREKKTSKIRTMDPSWGEFTCDQWTLLTMGQQSKNH